MDALKSDAPLIIYIDVKSPYALVAIGPTLKLAQRYGLAIGWRAYSMAERDIPDSGANRAVIESHRVARARSRRAIDQKYARLRGMTLTFPENKGPCDLALGALTEISGDRLPFIRAAMAACWEEHRDLDDPVVVADILAQCRVECSDDLGSARGAFAATQAAALDAGIVEAPAFVIDGQLFIGRQHLPWIEEIARAKVAAS
ncbi:MAG: hypothetical protein HRT64_12105 [Erythrobacter sp.]|nr:hypothetical protein [Erythrobacter sp.]